MYKWCQTDLALQRCLFSLCLDSLCHQVANFGDKVRNSCDVSSAKRRVVDLQLARCGTYHVDDESTKSKYFSTVSVCRLGGTLLVYLQEPPW